MDFAVEEFAAHRSGSCRGEISTTGDTIGRGGTGGGSASGLCDRQHGDLGQREVAEVKGGTGGKGPMIPILLSRIVETPRLLGTTTLQRWISNVIFRRRMRGTSRIRQICGVVVHRDTLPTTPFSHTLVRKYFRIGKAVSSWSSIK